MAMKKIAFYTLLVGNILLLSFSINPVCMADEVVEHIAFDWDWEGPTPEDSGLPSADPIANDLEFHLYVSDQTGVYNLGTPDYIISYIESTTRPYEIDLNVTGDGGTIVTKYFVLTSAYNGDESGTSNEVSANIDIPMGELPPPSDLKILALSQLISDGNYSITDAGGLAEQFILTQSITITDYYVWVKDDNQIGSLTVGLMGDAAGIPDGTFISGTSKTLSNSELDDTSVIKTLFPLDAPFELPAGTYHIVIQNDGAAGLDFTCSRNGASVTDGIYSSKNGASWANYDKELQFEIWGYEAP